MSSQVSADCAIASHFSLAFAVKSEVAVATADPNNTLSQFDSVVTVTETTAIPFTIVSLLADVVTVEDTVAPSI